LRGRGWARQDDHLGEACLHVGATDGKDGV